MLQEAHMVKKTDNGAVKIDLIEILRMLWNKALVIILSALLAGSAAFAYTFFFVEPTYEAVASMYVNNSSFSFGSTSFSISSSEISASNSLVNSYIFLLESRTTLEAIIADTGVNYSYTQLKEKIVKAEAVPTTPAFKVTVSSTDPQEAELIANSIAKILPERISEIIDGASVRIVDYAIIPSHRASPNYVKTIAIFGFLGAFVAAAWCVVSSITRELHNTDIGDANNIKKLYPHLHILATIPDMDLSEKKGYYYSPYSGSGKKEG